MNPLTIRLIQLSAGRDVQANLARAERMMGSAPDCDVLALPEVFLMRGSDADYRAAAEPIPGPTTERLSKLAAQRTAWILAGSLLEKDGDCVFNTLVLFDRSGALHATYRKMHLFEAHLEDGKVVREQDAYTAGDEPTLTDIEGWACGLSICYDLRFPELYRHYSAQGAHLLFVPSNFTQRTGRDHWEVLLRARAIENQCFIVAPGQCGTNPVTGVTSHGHSLAVDPWGTVLAEAGDEEGVVTVTLDPARLEETRARVPVLKHRKM